MAFDITGQLNLRLASGAIRNVAGEINAGLRSSGIGAINIPVKVDTAALNNLRAQMAQTGSAAERFAQQSGLAFKRFAAFTLAASPFIALTASIRTAMSEAMTFDKEMVRLRQVTVEAGSEVGAIAKEVTRLSTTFGVSSQELIKTAVTLKQANLSINDTKDALEALAKSALAPNFDSMAQTTEGAIAVMNQFKIKGKELEQALGSMNAVAGEFAVEAGDLIEVVRRTGGAFQATGGDLNQLLALFTSVRQTTRESAESIATGLRTIFTRIQRNDTVNALKEFGVNLRYTREEATKAGNMGLENQFVGAYEAIRRLSAALTQLPAADPRYSAIIEDLGGYRQISKVIPLIQEFTVSERALMAAEAGRVSMTINAAQAADSYGNRLGRLQEAYSALGRSVMDSSSFRAAFDSFEMFAKGLAMVMDVARPLLPLLTALGTVKLATTIFPMTRNFFMGATYHANSLPTNKKANGGLAFASGGIVPGVGNTDSVFAPLEKDSFVLRKSAVNSLKKMATGGIVPAMVMPGEYIFSPQEARSIGYGTLSHLNSTGSLPGFADGGSVGRPSIDFDPSFQEKLNPKQLQELINNILKIHNKKNNQPFQVSGIEPITALRLASYQARVNKLLGEEKYPEKFFRPDLYNTKAIQAYIEEQQKWLDDNETDKNYKGGKEGKQKILNQKISFENLKKFITTKEVLDFSPEEQGFEFDEYVSDLISKHNLRNVDPSGPDDKILIRDVEKAIREKNNPPKPIVMPADPATKPVETSIASNAGAVENAGEVHPVIADIRRKDGMVSSSIQKLKPLSPSAKKIAKENNLTDKELASINPSGKKGGLTVNDLQQFIEQKAKKAKLIEDYEKKQKEKEFLETYKAQKLASNIGIDLSEIKGTGSNGAVTEKDVRNYQKKLMDNYESSLGSAVNPTYYNREVNPADSGTIPDELQIADQDRGPILKRRAIAKLPDSIRPKILSPEFNKSLDKSVVSGKEYDSFNAAMAEKQRQEEIAEEKRLIASGQAIDPNAAVIREKGGPITQIKKNSMLPHGERRKLTEKANRLVDKSMLSDEDYRKFVESSDKIEEEKLIAAGQAFDPNAKIREEKAGPDTPRRRRNRIAADAAGMNDPAGLKVLPKPGVSAGYIPGSQPNADMGEFDMKLTNNPVQMQQEFVRSLMFQLHKTNDPAARNNLYKNLRAQVDGLSKMTDIKPQDLVEVQAGKFNLNSRTVNSIRNSIRKKVQGTIESIDQLIDQINIDKEIAESDPAAQKRRNANLLRLGKITNRSSSLAGIRRSSILGKDEYGQYQNNISNSEADIFSGINIDGSISQIEYTIKRLNKTSKSNIFDPKEMKKRNQIKSKLKSQLKEFKNTFGFDISEALEKTAGNVWYKENTEGKIEQATGRTLQQIVTGRTQEKVDAIDPKGKGENVSDVKKQAILDEELARVQREYVDGQARILMKQKGLTSLEEARSILTQQFNDAMKGNILFMERNASTGRTLVATDSVKKGMTGDPEKGTLAYEIKRRYEDSLSKIDPKGKGGNLAEATKQELLAKAELSVRNDAVETIKNQIIEGKKLKDAQAAEVLAHEKVTKALDENHQVIIKGNKIMDAQMAAAGNEGRRASRMQVLDSVKDSAKGMMTLGNLGNLSAVIGSYIGDAIYQSAGSAETAVQANDGSDNSYVTKKVLGSGITGAASGALAGASAGFFMGGGPANPFSPLLAGIGAAVGAVGGMVKSFKEASSEISEARIGYAIKRVNEALSNFGRGTYALSPKNISEINQNFDTADKELGVNAGRNTSWLLGTISGSQESFTSELTKTMRESMAGQASSMMDALTKLVQDEAGKNFGNANMADFASRQKAFNSVFQQNGGIGSRLFARTATATGQDPELFRKNLFDLFQRSMENEAIKRRQQTAETEVNRSVANFGGLSSAVETATQRLSKMTASLKNVSDFMDGTISPFVGPGLSEALQRPLGTDREDFMGAIRSITSTAGVAGGEVEKTADAVTVAGRLLPGIINAVRSQPVANLATGSDISIQIGDMLRKGLSSRGIDNTAGAMVTNLVSSQLGTEDFSKMLRETGQDMGKVIQKLLGPMAEPLKQSFTDIAKNLDERGRVFADGLAELANRTRAAGELIDKANMAEMAAARNRIQVAAKRKLISEDASDAGAFNMGQALLQGRQARLTGFGGPQAQNPQFIANALGGIFDDIRKTEDQIARATKGGNIGEQNAASTQLASLKTRAADLGQALKNLTDVSERTSQAQEKLAKIQSDREGRQALGMRYATASVEGRSEIASSFKLLDAAARMGSASNFSVKQQNQIFGLLSSLSPQMRLPGLGGVSVKDLTSQLLKTTFGGAFDLDPQTAALERALEGFVQNNYDVAMEAARIQSEIQQKLQSDFFSRLQNSQQTFINELSRIMMENQNLMRESLQMQAQSKLENLEKQVGQSSMLGKLGVNSDDQFKALVATLNDPKNKNIDTIFEAGKNQKIANAKAEEALANTDRFVQDLVSTSGNSSARGTSKSDVSGVLMNKFGEMGFTSATDQSKLVSLFSENLNSKARYLSTIGSNQENVAEAFRYAITTLQTEKTERANIDIVQAKDNLTNQGTLDQKIIDNLVNAAIKEGDNVTIKTLRDSVAAVNTTNKKFSELNESLDQARQQVQNFAGVLPGKPEGKANGGPVRFFNKGGWGHGGSTTPHSSDTINARISPNEFVVAAGPAQRNKKLLENINSGYAEGGVVVDPKKVGVNQAISQMDPKNILNPEVYTDAIDKSKKLVRLNAEMMFLSQLKNLNPDELGKFLNDQSAKLDSISGKENDQQLGIKDAIDKINKIKNAAVKSFDTNKLAEYHSSVRTAAIGFALENASFEKEKSTGHLKNIGIFGDTVVNRGNSAKTYVEGIDKIFKEKNNTTLSELLSQNPGLSNHKWLSSVGDLSKSVDQNLLKIEFGSLRQHKQRIADAMNPGLTNVAVNAIKSMFVKRMRLPEMVELEVLHQKYGGDPNALRPEIIFEHLEKWYSRTHSGLSKTKTSDFIEDVQINLSGKNKDIQAIIDEAAKKVLNEKQQLEKAEEIKGMIKRGAETRTSAFSTPEEGILKIFGDRNDKFFGREQDKQLMQLQLMAMEANAFNRLPPAIQSKLLEQKRSRITNGQLTPTERDQLSKAGLLDAMNSTKDLTAEEINGLSAKKSQMTLVQRAAFEILMSKALSGAREKINKDPDSLSPAEKAAYLVTLDMEGRQAAFAEFSDPKNAVLLTRIGQYITNNPGGIQKMLDSAKEKGAAAYAKEASLLELISAAFGATTTLPKASEVYKDQSLRSKAQAQEQPKAPPPVAAPAPGAPNNNEKEKPALFGVDEANKRLPGFASGGLVPGVGNTDSVRANLPVGSYVIRKSSVQKLGSETLASLPHMASGGVVPAMVMPGEHIFTPKEASKIGKANLDHINRTGSLPGYNDGGIVINGVRYMPTGTEKWGSSRVGAAGFQPNSLNTSNNSMVAKSAANQTINEAQFLAIERINQEIGGAGGITALKAKFFSLRNSMRDPRQRTKENIAQLRQMYATLTNPMVVQMDAQRQMMGAQEAFASFQQDPKAFIAKSKELRALAANAKASMEERISAKEQLNQMNYAARFIDPRALRGAAAAAQKQQQPQPQQPAAVNAPIQGGLLRAAENPVEAHNARVRANEQNKPEPNRKAAEANHLKKMLEIAQENYLKTGDPRYLQEINKIKNPEKVRAEEEAEAKRKMDEYRAKKQSEEHGNEIARWHVREGIEDIKDPGGVKRGAEKLRKFYAEKEKQRQEFEGRVFAHAPTYEENMPKMQKEWDEKNKGFVENRIKELEKESNERLNRNPMHTAIYARLANSPYLDKKDIVKKATGGIVPGVGSGDTVPALLEPGELVVPKKQVQKFANGGVVGGMRGFAQGGMAEGGPDMLDVAARFNQAATQISQGLAGFSTSVSTFNGAVANFGTFVDKFDEAVGKIPGQIELSGANDISVNLMGQDSIVQAVAQAIGPMIAQAIRDNQPVEQRAQ